MVGLKTGKQCWELCVLLMCVCVFVCLCVYGRDRRTMRVG